MEKWGRAALGKGRESMWALSKPLPPTEAQTLTKSKARPGLSTSKRRRCALRAKAKHQPVSAAGKTKTKQVASSHRDRAVRADSSVPPPPSRRCPRTEAGSPGVIWDKLVICRRHLALSLQMRNLRKRELKSPGQQHAWSTGWKLGNVGVLGGHCC